MVDIGVLKELLWHNDSPWASLFFSIPKKTGDIGIVTYFREVNKWVEVDLFLLPQINEALKKLKKSKSATVLDLSFGFYLISLDKESQKICCTILPWGKYSYLRMPMDLACAPFMFQSIMVETFRGLDVLVYIDDTSVIQRQK